jgi:hypothetical protein
MQSGFQPLGAHVLCAAQAALFDFFAAILDSVVAHYKRTGTFDDRITTIRARPAQLHPCSCDVTSS